MAAHVACCKLHRVYTAGCNSLKHMKSITSGQTLICIISTKGKPVQRQERKAMGPKVLKIGAGFSDWPVPA